MPTYVTWLWPLFDFWPRYRVNAKTLSTLQLIGHHCYIHWPIMTNLGQDDHWVCPHMSCDFDLHLTFDLNIGLNPKFVGYINVFYASQKSEFYLLFSVITLLDEGWLQQKSLMMHLVASFGGQGSFRDQYRSFKVVDIDEEIVADMESIGWSWSDVHVCRGRWNQTWKLGEHTFATPGREVHLK